jgi:hypothetical protein
VSPYWLIVVMVLAPEPEGHMGIAWPYQTREACEEGIPFQRTFALKDWADARELRVECVEGWVEP